MHLVNRDSNSHWRIAMSVAKTYGLRIFKLTLYVFGSIFSNIAMVADTVPIVEMPSTPLKNYCAKSQGK